MLASHFLVRAVQPAIQLIRQSQIEDALSLSCLRNWNTNRNKNVHKYRLLSISSQKLQPLSVYSLHKTTICRKGSIRYFRKNKPIGCFIWASWPTGWHLGQHICWENSQIMYNVNKVCIPQSQQMYVDLLLYYDVINIVNITILSLNFYIMLLLHNAPLIWIEFLSH